MKTVHKEMTLFNSEYCYTALLSNGETVLGDYSTLLDGGAAERNIMYDYDCYKDQITEVKNIINKKIERYENRYKTDVIGVAMSGTVGTWRGNFIGGKVYDDMDSVINDICNYDCVAIIANPVVNIKLAHHDGTHYFNLYLITDSKIKKLGSDIYDTYNDCGINGLNEPETLEKIVKTLKEVRINEKDF